MGNIFKWGAIQGTSRTSDAESLFVSNTFFVKGFRVPGNKGSQNGVGKKAVYKYLKRFPGTAPE